jgi:hypothetical protein
MDIIRFPRKNICRYGYLASIPVTRWVSDMWAMRIQYIILNPPKNQFSSMTYCLVLKLSFDVVGMLDFLKYDKIVVWC